MSPSSYVTNFKTPCLVISGERDYRVPYTQSLEFYTSLQKMNVPSKLIIYSNAGHWPNWYEMALYYTAHLEWFPSVSGRRRGRRGPPRSSFRNEVFDPSSRPAWRRLRGPGLSPLEPWPPIEQAWNSQPYFLFPQTESARRR